jgi:hypothetical protein
MAGLTNLQWLDLSQLASLTKRQSLTLFECDHLSGDRSPLISGLSGPATERT